MYKRLEHYRNALKKSSCLLHKNAACYFKHILEATPQKIAAVESFAYNLTNHTSKTFMAC